jgi:hypothetical protein
MVSRFMALLVPVSLPVRRDRRAASRNEEVRE